MCKYNWWHFCCCTAAAAAVRGASTDGNGYNLYLIQLWVIFFDTDHCRINLMRLNLCDTHAMKPSLDTLALLNRTHFNEPRSEFCTSFIT